MDELKKILLKMNPCINRLSSLGTDDQSVLKKLDALKAVSASHGVHLTTEGYRNMDDNIMSSIERLKQGKSPRSAAVLLSGPQSAAGCRGASRRLGSGSMTGSSQPSYVLRSVQLLGEEGEIENMRA